MPGPRMLVLMLLPAIVAAALILFRGADNRVARISIRAWWLIIPAALLQWMNGEGHYPHWLGVETATRVVTAICLALIAVLCWVNWAGRGRMVRVGIGLILGGSLANAIPILVYGGMPYSTSAALSSGFSRQQLAEGANGHIPIESDHSVLLLAFSDLVPIPGLMKVVSIGDIALVIGLVVLLVGLAERHPTIPGMSPVSSRIEESDAMRRRPLSRPMSDPERG